MESSFQLEKPNESSKPIFQIGSNEQVDNNTGEELNPDDSANQCTLSTPMQCSDSDSKSDSASEDEQVRSRTPLLARHSSLEKKSSSKELSLNKNKEKEGTGVNEAGHCKRVSFSTRSLDGSQHYYHQQHKGRTKQYDISKGTLPLFLKLQQTNVNN